MSDIDRRVHEDEIEIRSESGRRPIVSGYAAVYNSKSRDLGGFTEVIRQGAFTNALASGRNVNAYFNHDPNMVLGSTQSGTLRLSENSRGLKYEIDLPDTTYANDLANLISRKDIRGNSFAFAPVKDQWSPQGNKRELIDVELHDVSIVTNPAYESAQIVSVRSIQSFARHKGLSVDAVKRRIMYYELVHPKWKVSNPNRDLTGRK